ncbi:MULTISPECIES: cell surface protein [unclassified Pseudoalteromonas]|uniref:cell surface protein n=1 Tax=unclassified Pseudoalteromonas TaxID=194690 RepID=UPI00110B7DA2|nr:MULTISPECIES: cell surface protein [unclassified Pseudoalteromonas]MDC9496794.1 cell surface protein [Pseudoalteromonas sp. Angola-20]MDC9516586.1 cell surface protein [Pseudoalteromonas sp. Angola-22]MDC9532917.1 cell surface protein [Pseudoalteromonas sp. Angola-9]TMP84342.1 cell surface protein [Pseudoalteromonas sp. S983]
MIIRLSQLIFCFALFYSSQSAAYNEAMCILIKQEMQQYSNNKASAKYRSAARDFKRNCNKPKQVQTKPKPVEPPVVEQESQPLALTPEQEQQLLEQITAAEKAIKQSASKATTSSQPTNQISQQSSEINEPETAPINTVKDAPSTPKGELEPNSSELTPTTSQAQPVATETAPKAAPKIEPKKEQPTVNTTPKPAPVLIPAPVAEPPSSLLLPSLLLLIVVLIGAMVVIRLRRAKQNKPEPPVAPTATAPKNNNKSAAQAAPPKTAPAPSDELSKPVIPTVSASSEPEPASSNAPKNEAIYEPLPADTQATEAEPEQAKPEEDAPAPEPKKVAPEPNTAEFEAAAKNTLARIQNAKGFAEPEVREFNPDAPSVKRTRKHKAAAVEQPKAEPVEEVKPQESTLVNEPAAPSNPINEPNTSAQLHTADKNSELDQTTLNSEHDFKEPEIRTYNPDAPLKPSKEPAQATVSAKPNNEPTLDAPISTAHEPQPAQPEADSTPKQSDSSNPFANLSLDESWDPNSDKKPVIEEKKKAPKSQALIEAEERAKNMQTKE